MSEIFETTFLGSQALRNRTVRSATWEGLADRDGRVRPEAVSPVWQMKRRKKENNRNKQLS